jgi:hypothetical protein
MIVIKKSEGDITSSSKTFIPASTKQYTTNRTVRISSEPQNVACVLQDPLPLWSPWVHRRVHNSLSLCPPDTVPYFCKATSHIRLGFPSGQLSSGFPNYILYKFLISPVHATCPLLDLITLTISDEGCKLWRSSLCGVLPPPLRPVLKPIIRYAYCGLVGYDTV